MEGGWHIAPPGPRWRKRQLEQLPREPLACLFFFFSITPSPNLFLPPQNPYPTPLPAPASAVRRGLGLQGPRRQLRGREKTKATRMGETGFLIATGFKGAIGEPKNELLFFWPIAAVGGVGAGE